MIELVKKQKIPKSHISFNKFPGGLNTSVPASMASKEELTDCVDWKYNERGDLEIRGAITKYTTAACGAGVVSVGYAVISGTGRTLIADADDKIYYIGDASAVTMDGDGVTMGGETVTMGGDSSTNLIDTAEGEPQFLSYNDVCLVLDGEYVKYLDGITDLKIAYDTSEYQVDNYSGDVDAGIIVGNGTNIRAAIKFTSTTHTGYTIPPVTLEVWMKKVEDGGVSGVITGTIRKVSDDSVMATKVFTEDAGTLSTTGAFYDVTFTTVATELAPATDYYACIEYAGGDSNDYIEVGCSDDASTGYHYVAAWAADSDHNPIMRLSPGLPPKAAYGCISDNRPFLWGDPDNPGYSHFGRLTHLEWGYVSAVDDNRNTYEIGAMADLYGDLWAYGTEEQPYLSQLVGDTESDWILKRKFQAAWSLPKTINNIVNDLFTGSADGVDSLAGVQEYGDVRTFSESDRIKDKIDDNWVSTAFSGYYPKDGQYWLFIPGYSKVLICHTKLPNKPWTEYDLPITPTCFNMAGSNFLIGCGDGYLYQFDSSEYKDLTTTQILPKFSSAYIELPFDVDLTRVQFIASSLGGSQFNMDIYKNGNEDESVYTYDHLIAMSDSLTVEDLIMSIEDMFSAIDPQAVLPRIDLNINCWSFKVEISEVYSAGYPVYFGGLLMKYRQMEE